MDSSTLSAVMRSIFSTVAIISILLIIGTVLRAKFSIFQKMFLPASVIGGFIGLLLGPIVLKSYAILPFPSEWLTIASLLPGFLIVPVVASVPLGLKFRSEGKESSTEKPAILDMFLVLAIVGGIQNLYGFLVATVFRNSYNLYPTFGTELSAGFAGGHGTAGVVGSLLQSLEQPYWETAQGVTTTAATVGLVGGILIGILLINIASRKGYTVFIKDVAQMPEDMVTGVEKDINKQPMSGRESTNSSSIDSLSFHLALIMMVSGMAYMLVFLLKKYDVMILSSIPEWAYAILLMYGVWGIMVKLNLDWTVDSKTKSKISSTLTEFAVVAAIMSLPIETVFVYLVPLLLILIGGIILTVASSYYLSKWTFDNYWFERSLTVLGMNTGVFLTGLLLLKMVDPDLESPVLKDYSISYSINSVIGFIMIPLMFGLLIGESFLAAGSVYTGLLIIYGGALLFKLKRKGANL